MATINTVIEQADVLRENAYDDLLKADWVNQVEQTVLRDITGVENPEQLRYPEDGDKELTLTGEWAEIYTLYVVAKIDFWNRDTSLYNVSAKVFNDRLMDYKKQYIREHCPGGSHYTGIW